MASIGRLQPDRQPDRVPAFEVLIPRDRILRRTRQLADEIRRRFPDPHELCVVAVIEGARTFCRTLLAELGPGIAMHEIRAKSYVGTESSGAVSLGPVEFEIAGRDVLIVEDIVDTGRTMERLRREFGTREARSVSVVTLLSKPSRREVAVEVDWIGFEIPDRFVIGFGLDFDGRYRELPDVAVFDPALA